MTVFTLMRDVFSDTGGGGCLNGEEEKRVGRRGRRSFFYCGWRIRSFGGISDETGNFCFACCVYEAKLLRSIKME